MMGVGMDQKNRLGSGSIETLGGADDATVPFRASRSSKCNEPLLCFVPFLRVA